MESLNDIGRKPRRVGRGVGSRQAGKALEVRAVLLGNDEGVAVNDLPLKLWDAFERDGSSAFRERKGRFMVHDCAPPSRSHTPSMRWTPSTLSSFFGMR